MEPRSMGNWYVARDKITSFEMSWRLIRQLSRPEAAKVRFYFDQMELEKVDPDKNWGLDVWAARISYPHTVIKRGQQKNSYCHNINAKEFKLISDKGLWF